MPSHGRKHGDHCETFHCHRQRRPTPNISVCMGIDDVLQGFTEFSECIHSFFDHVFAIHRLPQLQSSVIQLPKVHYSSPIRLIEPRVWLDVKSRSRSLYLGCSIHPSPFACGLPRSVWPVCTENLIRID